MKHLVIFLNYFQSRLDNPVYRLFATESLYRRNATLLFLTKSLDERELQYEVASLRDNKDQSEDVTFHINACLLNEEEVTCVVSTLQQIRKFFTPDFNHHYPTFVYGQMPNLEATSADRKKIVWRNLVEINKAVSDHIDCRLLSTVFLYNDNTQKTLAEFIFSISHSNISYDKLSARLPVKQTVLFEQEDKDSEDFSVDFPPIFGGFNTMSLSYPEEETKTFLHYYYLNCVLKQSKTYYNETPADLCNSIVQDILSNIPLQTSRLCLQEDSFLRLNPEDNTLWQPVEPFWKENIEIQTHGLSDYPKQDWLMKIRQRVDSLYQGRFREIGTDYFFKLESKKTAQYSGILCNIITNAFLKQIQAYPFTPEAQKTIVRGIVNALQLKIMEIQNLKADTLKEISNIESELSVIKDKWSDLNIFSRMMGKNTQILSSYSETLTRLFIQKCIVPGCDFAETLLNELIPEVSGLSDRCDEFQNLFDEVISSVDKLVKDTNPSTLFGIFGEKDLSQTTTAIETDKGTLLKDYQKVISILVNNKMEDGDDFLMHLRETFNEKIDEYVYSRIEDCSIPSILGLSIVDRINRHTSNLGGFKFFIENDKRTSQITIRTKQHSKSRSKFILIAPEMTEEIEDVEHIVSEDISQIQLLNVKYGLTLYDLEGFSGQKMFVEPSIF